jgi:hypothetical protein
MLRGQWTRLDEFFTASENKGGRSTHVFYLYMLMCVVRKPAVPLWDRAGKSILSYPILSYPILNAKLSTGVPDNFRAENCSPSQHERPWGPAIDHTK